MTIDPNVLRANAQNCMNNATTLEKAAAGMAHMPGALEHQRGLMQSAALLHIAAAANALVALVIEETGK